MAFILAHEIAHIQKRHPIKSLSSGLLAGIVVSIVSGSIDGDDAAGVLASGTTLTALNFSRSQEKEADDIALKAVYEYYGHTLGSTDFFSRQDEGSTLHDFIEFASTHARSDKRIRRLRALSKALNHENTDTARLEPLPLFIMTEGE